MGGLLVLCVGLRTKEGLLKKCGLRKGRKRKRETKIYSRFFESRVLFSIFFFLFFSPHAPPYSTFNTYHTHQQTHTLFISKEGLQGHLKTRINQEYQNDTTNTQDAPHNVGSLWMQTPVVKIHSGTEPCPDCQDWYYTHYSNHPVTITPSSLQLYTRHLPKTRLHPQTCRLCFHLQQQRQRKRRPCPAVC